MVGHLKASIICSINIHRVDCKDVIKQNKLKMLSVLLLLLFTSLIAVTIVLLKRQLKEVLFELTV